MQFFPPADKYCSLVVSEGGIAILQSVVNREGVAPHITHLANTVLKHCQIYAVTRL